MVCNKNGDPTLSVHEAIFTARSMRHFKSDPILREKLEYIAKATTRAPSGSTK
jgi:nitroreductase